MDFWEEDQSLISCLKESSYQTSTAALLLQAQLHSHGYGSWVSIPSHPLSRNSWLQSWGVEGLWQARESLETLLCTKLTVSCPVGTGNRPSCGRYFDHCSDRLQYPFSSASFHGHSSRLWICFCFRVLSSTAAEPMHTGASNEQREGKSAGLKHTGRDQIAWAAVHRTCPLTSKFASLFHVGLFAIWELFKFSLTKLQVSIFHLSLSCLIESLFTWYQQGTPSPHSFRSLKLWEHSFGAWAGLSDLRLPKIFRVW